MGICAPKLLLYSEKHMSAITWSAVASPATATAASRSKITARRLGFCVGLVAATGTAYVALFVAVLLSTSILQF